jgi:metacaspase-1
VARTALLVGMNDYQRINDLNRCLNDVTNMRNILKTYLGFSNRD